MGISNGSISLSRYRILGDAKLSVSRLNKNLQNFVGSELELLSSNQEVQVSWVLPTGTLADSFEREGTYWDLSDCEVDGDYILKLRIEKRKVPTELLNALTKKEIEQLAAQRNKRPTRPEQKEVKESLKEELTRKALPQISYVDVIWKVNEAQVWLLSTAKTTKTLFEKIFKKTFLEKMNASMLPLEPALMGLTNNEWSQDSRKLEQLFAIVPTTVEKLSADLLHE